MYAPCSEGPARPDRTGQQRLAAQLADMIPGAATIRVSLNGSRTARPHTYALVRDVAGRPIELSPASRTSVARWIRRAWADADWTHAHVLDLITATLKPRYPGTTVRER